MFEFPTSTSLKNLPFFSTFFLLYTFSYKIASSLFSLYFFNHDRGHVTHLYLLVKYIDYFQIAKLVPLPPLLMFDCLKWDMGLWEKLVK